MNQVYANTKSTERGDKQFLTAERHTREHSATVPGGDSSGTVYYLSVTECHTSVIQPGNHLATKSPCHRKVWGAAISP